jgi:hypothetical protein
MNKVDNLPNFRISDYKKVVNLSQWWILGTVTYKRLHVYMDSLHSPSTRLPRGILGPVTYKPARSPLQQREMSQYTACPAAARGDWWYGHLYAPPTYLRRFGRNPAFIAWPSPKGRDDQSSFQTASGNVCVFYF